MIGQMIRHYRIDAELGEGMIGAVYRGTDLALQRPVVVKVLHPQLARDPAAMARFNQEAVIQARLSHPNILAVHEFDPAAGALITEYFEGRSLETIIAREVGPLPPARCLHIFGQVLAAMCQAHEYRDPDCPAGIIHRDLNPSNILVNAADLAKISDFGMARVVGKAKLRTVAGARRTVQYMSPEQVRDPGSVNQLSDIYSLGATLYHMATGRAPFEGIGEFEVMGRIMQGQLTPPSRVYPGVSPQLEALIMRAMNPAPALRFSSCREFLAALAQAQPAAQPSAPAGYGARPGYPSPPAPPYPGYPQPGWQPGPTGPQYLGSAPVPPGWGAQAPGWPHPGQPQGSAPPGAVSVYLQKAGPFLSRALSEIFSYNRWQLFVLPLLVFIATYAVGQLTQEPFDSDFMPGAYWVFFSKYLFVLLPLLGYLFDRMGARGGYWGIFGGIALALLIGSAESPTTTFVANHALFLAVACALALSAKTMADGLRPALIPVGLGLIFGAQAMGQTMARWTATEPSALKVMVLVCAAVGAALAYRLGGPAQPNPYPLFGDLPHFFNLLRQRPAQMLILAEFIVIPFLLGAGVFRFDSESGVFDVATNWSNWLGAPGAVIAGALLGLLVSESGSEGRLQRAMSAAALVAPGLVLLALVSRSTLILEVGFAAVCFWRIGLWTRALVSVPRPAIAWVVILGVAAGKLADNLMVWDLYYETGLVLGIGALAAWFITHYLPRLTPAWQSGDPTRAVGPLAPEPPMPADYPPLAVRFRSWLARVPEPFRGLLGGVATFWNWSMLGRALDLYVYFISALFLAAAAIGSWLILDSGIEEVVGYAAVVVLLIVLTLVYGLWRFVPDLIRILVSIEARSRPAGAENLPTQYVFFRAGRVFYRLMALAMIFVVFLPILWPSLVTQGFTQNYLLWEIPHGFDTVTRWFKPLWRDAAWVVFVGWVALLLSRRDWLRETAQKGGTAVAAGMAGIVVVVAGLIAAEFIDPFQWGLLNPFRVLALYYSGQVGLEARDFRLVIDLLPLLPLAWYLGLRPARRGMIDGLGPARALALVALVASVWLFLLQGRALPFRLIAAFSRDYGDRVTTAAYLLGLLTVVYALLRRPVPGAAFRRALPVILVIAVLGSAQVVEWVFIEFYRMIAEREHPVMKTLQLLRSYIPAAVIPGFNNTLDAFFAEKRVWFNLYSVAFGAFAVFNSWLISDALSLVGNIERNFRLSARVQPQRDTVYRIFNALKYVAWATLVTMFVAFTALAGEIPDVSEIFRQIGGGKVGELAALAAGWIIRSSGAPFTALKLAILIGLLGNLVMLLYDVESYTRSAARQPELSFFALRWFVKLMLAVAGLLVVSSIVSAGIMIELLDRMSVNELVVMVACGVIFALGAAQVFVLLFLVSLGRRFLEIEANLRTPSPEAPFNWFGVRLVSTIVRSFAALGPLWAVAVTIAIFFGVSETGKAELLLLIIPVAITAFLFYVFFAAFPDALDCLVKIEAHIRARMGRPAGPAPMAAPWSPPPGSPTAMPPRPAGPVPPR